MATDNQSKNRSESSASMTDRAGAFFQGGVDAVKNHPGAAAAVVGGVAAAAAAYVNRDRIMETASGLRDKMSSSDKSDSSSKA